MTIDANQERVATGVAGLDAILDGGLPRHGLYLVRGGPGTGKTTLGLEFLLQGVREGERVLYLTLSQTEAGLSRIARSHGWSLEGVDVQELAVGDLAGQAAAEQTLFHSADIELGETVAAFLKAVERLSPARVVFDSVAELRLLAGDALRYRRQMLGLRQFFTSRDCTALLLEDMTGDGDELSGLLDGIIALEQSAPEYGDVRRRLRVVKLRATAFHGGYHNFTIRTSGLAVYPRLEPTRTFEPADRGAVKSGVAELDALLCGGLDEGTACLVLGPTGTGKSVVTTLYAYAAAKRGENAAVFLFDERPETFYRRSEGLGMDVRSLETKGRISVVGVDTGELSPGEFAQHVRRSVEDGAKVVVIDSLTGYFHAMPQEDQLITQMHELLTYLSQRGVLSLLIVSQHGVVGTHVMAPVDVSYMADTILLLRHFEAQGALRKAISVVKKRYGAHEATIRELRITGEGVSVGEPIRAFSGILAGSPTFQGNQKALLDDGGEEADDEA